MILPSPDLVAVVRTAAVPDIPFASLAHVLEPVYDADHHLVDWALSSAVLERRLSGTGTARAYWAWRARWEHRLVLGPVNNVVALVDHTRRLAGVGPGPLDELLQVDRLAAGIDTDLVIDLDHHPDALEEARQLVVRAGGDGLGFVDETIARSGLARTWPAVRGEQVLAAAGGVQVVAGPGAELWLVQGGPGGVPTVRVGRADLTGDDAIVTSPAGATVRIPQAAARPLAWVVPGSLRWRVRTVDLVVVWADVFAGMLSALSVAAEHGGVVRFTTAPALVR